MGQTPVGRGIVEGGLYQPWHVSLPLPPPPGEAGLSPEPASPPASCAAISPSGCSVSFGVQACAADERYEGE